MADTYEKDLAQKSSLTPSDFIRVVGTDNVSYKQTITNLGSGFLEYIKYTNDDANNLLTAGVYYLGASATNVPVTYSFLMVFRGHGSNDLAQYLFTRAGDIYYRRGSVSGGLNEWTKQPTRAEVDALNRKLLKFTNTSNIQITLSNTPSQSHSGNAVLFNANQGTVAMFNLSTSPTATVVSGSRTYTVSLSGKTFTITPNTTLWGITQVYFDEV